MARSIEHGRTHAHVPSIGARAVVIPLLTSIGLLVAAQAQAGSMRCDGKLIEAGDTKARLVTACGEPETKSVVAVERSVAGGVPVRLDVVEEWSYPAPNTEGFRILRFEGGLIVGDGMRCEGVLVGPGDTPSTVIARCGLPALRDTIGLAPGAPAPAVDEAPVLEVPVEQWVYDRGPGRFLAIVTLRGGRVEAIEDGRRR
jgi:hypothetical protein